MDGIWSFPSLHSVITNRLYRAAFFGFFAASFLLGRFGLFVNKRIAAIVVPFEVIGGSFAAEITVNALVVHVIFAGNALGVFICYIGHKNFYSTRNMSALAELGKRN